MNQQRASVRDPHRHASDTACAATDVSWGHSAKRLLDVVASAGALCVLGPWIAATAGAIRLETQGNPFFVQTRVGRNGRQFHIIKLRTMAHGASVVYNDDGSTRLLPNDPRVTRLGALLRGGLDELPQLINVLKGDMSLVGPRPDMPEHELLYTERERRKLSVRPGMTSLAAVLGRNGLPWKKRIAIDLRYIDAWSLRLDLQIILATMLLPLGLKPFDFSDILRDPADE